jgi:RNA-directed DNA polymerase
LRSVPAGSFRRLSGIEALWTAWQACRRGKRRQPRLATFDLDADRHLLRLQRALRAGAYRPSPYRLSVVHDPKTRLVAAPAIVDRVVQHALLAEVAPTFERGFSDHSFACCTGRGPHRALLAYLAYARRFRFRLVLDIHHYFASIPHDRLLALFARRLRDAGTLDLVAALLAAGGAVYRTPLARSVLGPECASAGHGLPLGGYLSHWCGGLYLDGLDHYVKRVLKVPGYLRYMDDLVLFANDRDALAEQRQAVRAWLTAERELRLKDCRAPVVSTSARATFLGFRVSRAGIAYGPKMRRRLRQRLHSADVEGPQRLTRSLKAYRGLLVAFGRR